MFIRVYAPTPEKEQEVLDALQGRGVEVVTGEKSPLVAMLFYFARMNTKLDNLGQLRHLYKLLDHSGTLAMAAKSYMERADHERLEERYQSQRNLALWRDLTENAGYAHGELPYPSSIDFMTVDEIHDAFIGVSPKKKGLFGS